MIWKINFLLTAALTALSSRSYIDGYRRNVSYNVPNIFQRIENESLLKSQLTIFDRIENNVKSHAKDNFYKRGRSLENNDYIPNISKENCMQQILIDNVTNYPTDYVNRLIDENIIVNITNQSPENPERTSENNTRRPLLTLRLCKILKEALVPYAAYVQEDDKCYFVVNRKSTNGPLQGVQYESCDSEDQKCYRYGIPTQYEQKERYRQEYNTSCVQTYIQRSLMVLDYNGKLVQKPVKVKATCVCTKTNA